LSIDVIERRRAIEERLRRARNLTQALDQASADLAADSGQSIDDLDPAGSLRTAITTLAGVAALRPGFDVLVSLPDSPFALRLRHLTDEVDIALVHQTTAIPIAAVPTTAVASPAVDSTAVPTAPVTAPPALPEPRSVSDSVTTSDPEGAAASEPSEPEGHVASDLAAMLWQDVGPPPP
jgi:hypothetical protein